VSSPEDRTELERLREIERKRPARMTSRDWAELARLAEAEEAEIQARAQAEQDLR
jgi:hypothetical protein